MTGRAAARRIPQERRRRAVHGATPGKMGWRARRGVAREQTSCWGRGVSVDGLLPAPRSHAPRGRADQFAPAADPRGLHEFIGLDRSKPIRSSPSPTTRWGHRDRHQQPDPRAGHLGGGRRRGLAARQPSSSHRRVPLWARSRGRVARPCQTCRPRRNPTSSWPPPAASAKLLEQRATRTSALRHAAGDDGQDGRLRTRDAVQQAVSLREIRRLARGPRQGIALQPTCSTPSTRTARPRGVTLVSAIALQSRGARARDYIACEIERCFSTLAWHTGGRRLKCQPVTIDTWKPVERK